jgi:hypothetical protein
MMLLEENAESNFYLTNRKEPYTIEGIKRKFCVRCGRKPSYATWQICSLNNMFLPVCPVCDIGINRSTLDFVGVPNWMIQREMRKYVDKVIQECCLKYGKLPAWLKQELREECIKYSLNPQNYWIFQ